jgi:hypothetical protein
MKFENDEVEMSYKKKWSCALRLLTEMDGRGSTVLLSWQLLTLMFLFLRGREL